MVRYQAPNDGATRTICTGCDYQVAYPVTNLVGGDKIIVSANYTVSGVERYKRTYVYTLYLATVTPTSAPTPEWVLDGEAMCNDYTTVSVKP
eukprot:6808752-Pyramimonas_sp.AAC.2